MLSLLSGHAPRIHFTEDRVPIDIAPEVRARLQSLLLSPPFQSSGVGYSAFIDRACEVAETEYAERLAQEAGR